MAIAANVNSIPRPLHASTTPIRACGRTITFPSATADSPSVWSVAVLAIAATLCNGRPSATSTRYGRGIMKTRNAIDGQAARKALRPPSTTATPAIEGSSDAASTQPT